MKQLDDILDSDLKCHAIGTITAERKREDDSRAVWLTLTDKQLDKLIVNLQRLRKEAGNELTAIDLIGLREEDGNCLITAQVGLAGFSPYQR